MNTAKKLLGILLAVLLMASLGTAAFADDAHSYTAYQIFSGTQASGSANLAGINWGSGIDGTNFLEALKASTAFVTSNPFASCTDANGVATAMAAWEDSSENALTFAKLAYQYKTGSGTACAAGTTTLDAGYYLVVDAGTSASTGGYTNLALLQLTNKSTFDIAVKADAPTVIKKVKDINDSTDTALSSWQDSADYDVGDEIPFKLEATLPTELAAFPAYQLVFHDVECAGLTFDASSVKVYIGDSTTALANTEYAVSTSCGDECTFEVTVYDVIKNGGKPGGTVRVEYTATLNSESEIGSKGNPNEVYLEYSSNPNWSLTVDNKTYSVKNGKLYDGNTEVTDNTVLTKAKKDGGPLGEESKETSKTVKDKVIVFTYKLTANKTDGTNALPGANFALYKFILSAEGKDTYNETNGTWTLVTPDTWGDNPTTFTWSRVDDGVYKLVETATPAGYNTLPDQIFTVSAEHDVESDSPALASLTGEAASGEITFTADTDDAGKLETTVVNKAGSTLPETGGIGTTIFYVAGSVLLVGAAILLITKKRMNAKS